MNCFSSKDISTWKLAVFPQESNFIKNYNATNIIKNTFLYNHPKSLYILYVLTVKFLVEKLLIYDQL